MLSAKTNKSIFKDKLFVLLKMSILFVFTIVTFFALLVGTYLLPNDKIKENAYTAVESFNKEGTYYAPFFTSDTHISTSMRLDNFTDALILNTAFDNSNNKNVFEKAVLNSRYNNGEDQITSLEKKYTENTENNVEYTRYWFGIYAVLKPLLTVFSYQSIRYINMVAIFALLFLNVVLINKKLNIKYALAYFISILLCGVMIIPMSLQYTPIFVITLIASIIILLFYEKEKFKKFLPYMFLLIGCFAAYFDLLTSPLLTFGIPLIIVMLLRNKEKKYTIKENIIFVIKNGIIWGLSYAMTYFSKWIIASIVLNRNEITTAWEQFTFRANMDESSQFSRMETLKNNFDLYFNKFVLTFLVIYLIINLIVIIKNKHYKNVNYKNLIIFIGISVLPYLWYVVLTNHSSIHYWMTYRIQAITMMCILSGISSFYDNKILSK